MSEMTIGRGAAHHATNEKNYWEYIVESTPRFGLEGLSKIGFSVES
jgi:hypothetical protein